MSHPLGFERLIDVLGADHHGYVARLRGGGTLPLAYTGPSTFSATVPAKEKVIGVIATEAINGNTGVSFA